MNEYICSYCKKKVNIDSTKKWLYYFCLEKGDSAIMRIKTIKKKCIICDEKDAIAKSMCQKCYNKQYQKEWRAKNPGKQAEYQRNYKKKNPDKYQKQLETQLKRRQNNREMFRERYKKQDDERFFGGHRSEVIAREKGVCALCGEISRNEIHHIDFKGRSKGVKKRNNDILNLIYLCAKCHRHAHSTGKHREPIDLKIKEYINNIIK